MATFEAKVAAAMRACVFYVVFVCAFALGATRAFAAIEYCPAHIATLQTIDPSHVAVVLEAEGPRTVSGALRLSTQASWLETGFRAIPLRQTLVQETWEHLNLVRTAFRSDRIVVDLGGSQQIERGWIVQAAAEDDPTFGWDAKGMVACDAPGLMTPASGDPINASAPIDAPALRALPVKVLAGVACESPFSAVTLRAAARGDGVAGNAKGTFVSVARVAVNADGRPDFAWIVASTGNKAFDLQVARMALRSTYLPARAFCQPVRGYFDFSYRVDNWPE